MWWAIGNNMEVRGNKSDAVIFKTQQKVSRRKEGLLVEM